jgi:exodeoxyribonuclease VII small subunit
MPEQKAIKSMSFEESLAELDTIVRGLESGKAPLEDSISLYERGIELKKHCEKKLRDAQMKIEKIVASEDGTVATKPLDKEQ